METFAILGGLAAAAAAGAGLGIGARLIPVGRHAYRDLNVMKHGREFRLRGRAEEVDRLRGSLARPEGRSIITNVETEEATVNDNYSLPKIHERLSRAELLPDKHLVDAGYIEASNLVESRREHDIELIGPAQSNGRWQQVQGNGFDISNFQVDWDREKVICPAGRESSSWKPMVDRRGNDFIHAASARSDCSACPHLSQCTSAKGRRRTINLKPKELHEALQQNRRREETKEFKEEYRRRAGVEGTISQGVRAFGLRRSRYLGIAKTRLQHLATAAAINLERVSDWLDGVDREKTRRSAFARVMQPLAA